MDEDFFDVMADFRKTVSEGYSKELGKLLDWSRLYDPAESEALKEEEVDW